MNRMRDRLEDAGITPESFGKNDLRPPQLCVFNYVLDQNFRAMKSILGMLVQYIWPENANVIEEAIRQREYEPRLCAKSALCGLWDEKNRRCTAQVALAMGEMMLADDGVLDLLREAACKTVGRTYLPPPNSRRNGKGQANGR